MSVRRWLIVLCSSSMIHRFFFLGGVTVQRVTEITLMADLFISSFRSVNFCFMYFETVFLNAYRIVNVFWWIVPLNVSFYFGNILRLEVLLFLVLCFIKLIACMNYVFPLLYFQPIHILYLKYIFFCRHFASCIHSDKSPAYWSMWCIYV